MCSGLSHPWQNIDYEVTFNEMTAPRRSKKDRKKNKTHLGLLVFGVSNGLGINPVLGLALSRVIDFLGQQDIPVLL
jgi:hypothetical protein